MAENERKKDWASGEEYAPTAVRRDGLGPTQAQINAQQQPVNTPAQQTPTQAVQPAQQTPAQQTPAQQTPTQAVQPAQQTPTQAVQTAQQTYTANPYQDTASSLAGLKTAAQENAAASKIAHLDTSGFKDTLSQWMNTANNQAVNRIDYGVRQGVNELARVQEDANAQYDTQLRQIARDEAIARDNQQLYAAQRGDRGGIGAAQYDSIANAAMQNRTAVNTARTKMTTDVARQITDLRAQGEFEKADALLELTQQYLSQLMSLEQWAASYNLSVDQFNASLDQWAADYALQLEQMDIQNQQWWTNYNRGVYENDRAYERGVLESDRAYERGVFESDRAYDYQQGRAARSDFEFDTTNRQQEDQRAIDNAYRDKRAARSDFEFDTTNRQNQEQRNFENGVTLRNLGNQERWHDEAAAQDAKTQAYNYAWTLMESGIMPDSATLQRAGITENAAAVYVSNARNQQEISKQNASLDMEAKRASIEKTRADAAKSQAAADSGGSGGNKQGKPTLTAAQVDTAIGNGTLTTGVLSAYEYYHHESYYKKHPEELSATAKGYIGSFQSEMERTGNRNMTEGQKKVLVSAVEKGFITDAELGGILDILGW